MCKCAECGTAFKRKQAKQLFCTPACKTTYWNRMGKRGKQLAPLMMAWRGARSAEHGKAAFREGCRLIADWNTEDKKAGRLEAKNLVDHQERHGLRG